MDKNDNKNKKHANTEAQKKDETQKFSDSEKLSDSVVAREILKKRVEELENQTKRVLADYRNLEQRVESQRGEWMLNANKTLLLNILPVLDTLMLANKHSQDQNLKVSLQQFLDVLKKEGIEKIETAGKEFDPHLMEVIEVVEGEEGRVIEELRAGYTLYEKVLRPAHVKVGKGK